VLSPTLRTLFLAHLQFACKLISLQSKVVQRHY
jgi:hypothetical protein